MEDPIIAFLPYKFEAIPHVLRLQQDSKISERTGWNLRKSIRWKAVHDENTSPELLKRLGDALVEGTDLQPGDLPNIHRLLLKRSTYNSKTRSFDRAAKISGIWKRVSDTFSIASQHPEYIAEKLLASGYGRHLRNLSSSGVQEWLNEYGRIAFHVEWLNTLISEVREIGVTSSVNLPDDPSFEKLLNGSESEIACEIREALSAPYADYCLEVPEGGQLRDFVSKVSVDMGIGPIDVTQATLALPSIREAPTSTIAFSYEDFEGIDLLRTSRDRGFTTVKVNARHPLVNSSGFSRITFEIVLEGILKTCEKINFNPEEEEEFLKYLGLTMRTFLSTRDSSKVEEG